LTEIADAVRAVPGVPRLLSRRRALIMVAQITIAALLVLAWWLASDRLVSSSWISDPVSVAERLVDWLGESAIYGHVWSTLKHAAMGLALGAAGGVMLGVLFGQWRLGGRVVEPFVSAVYSIPQIAVFPLFVLWFGIDSRPKIAVVASMVFFPLYFSAMAGSRAADPDLVAAVKVMGASRVQVLRYAVLPALGAYVAAGVAIAVPLALLASLLGDMLVGSEGLGFVIVSASNAFDMTGVLAGAVLMMFLGLIAVQLITGRTLGHLRRLRPGRPAAAGARLTSAS